MPSAPVMGDGMTSATCQPSSVMALDDSFDGEFVDFGIADDATFADVAATRFELRLDEDDGFSQLRCCCEDRGEQERCGDEGDVHDEQSECGLAGFGKCLGCEESGVGALDEVNAGIIAELHGDLSEASVDGGDVCGATLQKAVSESTGGSADVEAGSAGDVDLPVIEGGLEFEATATDEGHVFAEKADGGVGGDGGAGFVDFLLVDEDAAGKDEGAGAFAALDEASFDEEEIDAGFDVGGRQGVRVVLRIIAMRSGLRPALFRIVFLRMQPNGCRLSPYYPVSVRKFPIFSGLRIGGAGKYFMQLELAADSSAEKT